MRQLRKNRGRKRFMVIVILGSVLGLSPAHASECNLYVLEDGSMTELCKNDDGVIEADAGSLSTESAQTSIGGEGAGGSTEDVASLDEGSMAIPSFLAPFKRLHRALGGR